MFILFVLAACLSIIGTDAQCYHDWYEFHGACYGLAQEVVTWADGLELCKTYNSHLAEIGSREENAFLKNLTRTKLGGSAWIGGTDIFSNGFWEWAWSKEPITGGSFDDWAGGEPNDNDGLGGEDCLEIESTKNWKWNDQNCDQLRYVICEQEPSDVVVG